MRAEVELPIGDCLSNDKNDEKKKGLPERLNGKRPQDNSDMQGNHARIGCHHLLGESASDVFLFSKEIHEEGEKVADEKGQDRPGKRSERLGLRAVV